MKSLRGLCSQWLLSCTLITKIRHLGIIGSKIIKITQSSLTRPQLRHLLIEFNTLTVDNPLWERSQTPVVLMSSDTVVIDRPQRRSNNHLTRLRVKVPFVRSIIASHLNSCWNQAHQSHARAHWDTTAVGVPNALIHSNITNHLITRLSIDKARAAPRYDRNLRTVSLHKGHKWPKDSQWFQLTNSYMEWLTNLLSTSTPSQNNYSSPGKNQWSSKMKRV